MTPVRGSTTLARVDLTGIGHPYGCENCQSFVATGGPGPDQSVLVILRRIDLPDYPVDALRITVPASDY